MQALQHWCRVSIKDRLLGGPETAPHIKPKKVNHPSGWEPHVVETTDKAEVVTQPISGNPDHKDLLMESGLDPEHWSIVSEVQVRRWQQKEGGGWLRYFKFTARSGKANHDPELKAALDKLLRHKPRRPEKRPVKHARVFCISDTQIGKGEGIGSAGVAAMVEEMVDKVAHICKTEKPDAVYLIGMGDIVEGCFGSYPNQAFSIDLDQSEQERFARRMILAFVKAIAPHTPRLVVGAVKGNHGAVRNQTGSSSGFTHTNDNRDILVVESVIEMLAEAPAYDHVSFIHPGNDIALTLDIAGSIISFVHGDEFGSGANPLEKAVNWFKGQAGGSLPPGSAECTVWAHYHHSIQANRLGKWFIQCPALDPGSDWYTRKTGEHSQPGMATIRVGDGVIEPSFLPCTMKHVVRQTEPSTGCPDA